MKTRLKTMFGAAIAAATIAITPAGAKGITSPLTESGADTYGGCSIGGSFGYRGGYSRGGHFNSGRYNSGHYSSRYRGSYGHASYSNRCRIVDRHYYRSGCYNYCRITYLHERVDCHGHIVSCWRSCKTVRC
jgi:hypothetical protein